MNKTLFASFFLFLCVLTAAPSFATTPEARPLNIVASFSILGDMVAQVGGDAVALTTLVGAGQDAHVFEPAPDAVKALAQADIIVINGLGFEPWMHKAIKASGTKAKLLVASSGVAPRRLDEKKSHAHKSHHGHGHDDVDPHAWQNLKNGALYVRNIANALSAARPERAALMKERAQTYEKALLDLDEKARHAFAALPPEKRVLITHHDAFGYFADAYGFKVLTPVGLSTEAEPSAAALGALIDQIRAAGIKTLYLENMSDARLIEQIAQETGATIGGSLYADALSDPKGEAPTYLAMMETNVKRVLNDAKKP